MTKPSRKLLLLLAAVLALAGCGSTSHSTTTAHLAPVQAVGGHACSPANEVMQCVLGKLPPPLRTFGAAPFSANGVDFAWSCPLIAGKQFGASYFSPDLTKNWSSGCVNAYHRAGQATVGVYESSADRATQGFTAGFNDAFTARSQARGVGEPDSRPIDFAVDCDCSLSSIFYYFVGADSGTASVLHISHAAAVQLVGVYGGYSQVGGLFAAHVVGHTNWQTYAWSGGLWQPASIAPLRQWLNDNSVDYDVALAPDYGQWPYKVLPPPPPPGPTPAQLQSWAGARDSSLGAYRARKCSEPLFGIPACGTFAKRVLFWQRRIDAARPHPVCWGAHAQRNAAACQIVRPEVASLSRARDATTVALQGHGCNGPVSFPAPVHSKLCNALRSREKYFDARVRSLLTEF